MLDKLYNNCMEIHNLRLENGPQPLRKDCFLQNNYYKYFYSYFQCLDNFLVSIFFHDPPFLPKSSLTPLLFVRVTPFLTGPG